MTSLPPISVPRHPRPAPFNRSTAQNTATRIADHPNPRARFNSPAPSSHTQPHGTQQWPNPDVVASTRTPHASPTCTSPEVSSPYSQPHPQRAERWGVGQSGTVHDHDQLSSPMTSSPQTASNPAEFAPQSSSFEQKSVETHSGKKRHKCDVCGSYWGRPSSLKIHMVSHTGVKGTDQGRFPSYSRSDVDCLEFMCSICKQDFGVKSNYTRHIRVHHKDSNEGIQTRVAGRRRRGSRRNQDGGPVRFVDEGTRFQGQ